MFGGGGATPSAFFYDSWFVCWLLRYSAGNFEASLETEVKTTK